MWKYFSIILTVVGWSLGARAQVLSFSFDSVHVTGSSVDYELVANTNIENLTASDQQVVWRRIINNLPAGWTSSVCDKNACWGYNTDTKAFLLPAYRGEKLDVHFYPNNIPGQATVELIAYVQNDSANTLVRAVYKAGAEQPANVAVVKKNLLINIYPNPVKDIMMVKGLLDNQTYRLELYSILGMKVGSYVLAAGSSQGGVHEIDVSDLPKGVYMIRILDKNMNLVFNRSISKMK